MVVSPDPPCCLCEREDTVTWVRVGRRRMLQGRVCMDCMEAMTPEALLDAVADAVKAQDQRRDQSWRDSDG